jgi:3-oxoacyl-[acyl-carrier protein] reductase
MDLGLSGTACLVTGASRGIGLATAKALAAEGADVLICARDQRRLAEAGEEIAAAGRPAGAQVISAPADVTDPEAAAQLVDACLQRFGRIDALVNNAGTSEVKPLYDLSDGDWYGQFNLNVMASLWLMKAAAPKMAQAGGGRIVNVTSSSGRRPSPRNGAYSVAKAGQLSLSRVFADAHARDNVRVNAVVPGPVSTELWTGENGMAAQTVALGGGDSIEAVIEKIEAGIPRGQLGTAEEVAAVIAFLCSPRAANVSGAAWSVDGGIVPAIF